ncbi:MAG: DUF167 domain-containing protein [Candidatus Korarchaeota archaeon]|nr:DUF167 domain-containing protein [Candidatus Korarchaeota archaeon]
MLVHPRARRRGVEVEGDLTVVYVRSPPEKGRANEEAREILAEYFGVSKSRVRLVKGLRSREKVFEVEGVGEP